MLNAVVMIGGTIDMMGMMLMPIEVAELEKLSSMNFSLNWTVNGTMKY